MNYINKGWPSNQGECDPNAALFFNYRDELRDELRFSSNLLFPQDRLSLDGTVPLLAFLYHVLRITFLLFPM